MSMQPVATAGDRTPLAIEVADRIRVVDKQGVARELTVTEVGSDFIEGTAGDGQTVRIRASDIQELRERRLATGKTIALAVGLGVLVILDDITEDVLDFGP